VRSRDRRAGLTTGKPPRPHPAAPKPTPPDGAGAGGAPPAQARDEELVMFCVRVPRGLRRQIKIAAAQGGTSVQALGVAALQAECRRRGL
jgi:hypothetical protein